MRKDSLKFMIAGAGAGAINGLFGAGGGMILVPLLIGWCHLKDQEAFATSLAVIFPITAVSVSIYFLRDSMAFSDALPYLLGGTAGGVLGGLLLKRMPLRLLHGIFGIFILWGGFRNLCC